MICKMYPLVFYGIFVMNNAIRMLFFIFIFSFLIACEKKEENSHSVRKESGSADESITTLQSSTDALSRQEKEFSGVSNELEKSLDYNNLDKRAIQEAILDINNWLMYANKLLKSYIDVNEKLSIMMQSQKNSGNTDFVTTNSKLSIALKERIRLLKSYISDMNRVNATLVNSIVATNLNSDDYKVMPPTQKNLEILSVKLKARQRSVNFNGAGLVTQIQTTIENAVKDVGGQYSFELTVGNYAHRIRTRDCNQQECFNMATFLVMTQTCAIGIGFEFQDPSILESMMGRCNGH